MTDPLLCTIHRVNSNKSHTHIPEIYNAEKNFAVELPKKNRCKILDLHTLLFCIEQKARTSRFFSV